MRNKILIEAPSNLGLKEPSPGIEPGVKFFSSSLLKEGFAEMADIKEIVNVNPPAYSMDLDNESKVRNADKIIDYSNELASVIDKQINNNKVPVVVGGDCSILMGIALSLKRNGNYGLFFIDGHTDYVLPHQSGSAGAAGMDLAIVTGNGHGKLTNIQHLKPYIEEENVFCFGNRDFSEDWYVNAIVQSNIHYFDLTMIRKRGISVITNDFLQLIHYKNLNGFWVHFDVDVLDDDIMPCVDSRQPGGLSYEELKLALRTLVASPLFKGIDITIFDPTLDKNNFYISRLASELVDCLKGEG